MMCSTGAWATYLEDGHVVAPGWGGNIHSLRSLEELGEEGRAYAQGTSAGDVLGRDHL